MKAYIIGNNNDNRSVTAMAACISSATFPVKMFQQVSAEDITEKELSQYTYPLEGETKTVDNLKLVGYRCSDVKKKIACTLSHLRLWKKCVELNEEIMILEHDALFVRSFKPFKWDGGVLGLNNPLGATRLSKVFYAKAEASEDGVSDCPFVDEQNVPQGLAGNSAYIIKAAFAERLINKVEEVGIWPNDALMCNQLFPNELKIITPFYTKVQGGISTTT